MARRSRTRSGLGLGFQTAIGIGALAGLAITRSLRTSRYRLTGKVVFISGGSRGLGLLIAHEFGRRGAKIAISARDTDALQRAVANLSNAGVEALAIETDISMREEAEAAVEQVRSKLGSIDILVNNAGTICVGPMEDMAIDDYRNSINTHFWGPYFATMAVLPEMQRRKQGRIVNISSIGGKISVPHLLPYSVGKFALTGFSEGLRTEAIKGQRLRDHGLSRTDAHRKSQKCVFQRAKQSRVCMVQYQRRASASFHGRNPRRTLHRKRLYSRRCRDRAFPAGETRGQDARSFSVDHRGYFRLGESMVALSGIRHPRQSGEPEFFGGFAVVDYDFERAGC